MHIVRLLCAAELEHIKKTIFIWEQEGVNYYARECLYVDNDEIVDKAEAIRKAAKFMMEYADRI